MIQPVEMAGSHGDHHPYIPPSHTTGLCIYIPIPHKEPSTGDAPLPLLPSSHSRLL